ncbi:GxxExxY protein [bacterium]|nr:GxxExxY protein [bacterium]MBU1064765.1 GxxExxY protein [bacterium]MBU1633081.1 GxxExxY protein [bacterium]MBU1872987.1 GxxExxY protein [bacterium]
MENLVFKEESFKIIGACMEVHKVLGPGFLESVYQEALAIEFSHQGIPFEQEKELTITFKGIELEKKYNADFVCYGKIILETKAVKELCDNHRAQIINYLKVTKFKLGLLVNFGEQSLKYERFINEK